MARPDFSVLPSVDRLLEDPALAAAAAEYGRAEALAGARQTLADARRALGAGGAPDPAELGPAAAAHIAARGRPSLRRVFNLTGVVLHTNLGRAPLPREAMAAIAQVAGNCNLEYDLETGRRGDRDSHVEALLTELTGAEAALVVNNNAAAVLLVLNSLSAGRDALVSRGELVEIGGSFRMPEIMARAGARMVEVGTTNRTHASDFEAAVGPDTGCVMKVHTSNYEVVGFTASVPDDRLARIAEAAGAPYAVDLGAGQLVDLARYGLPQEPMPGQALAAGAGLVTFSGDKLLGGPQAGIVVGRTDLVAALKQNPMRRAMRLGKLSLAALEAVLRLYRDPDRLAERLPALRALTRSVEEIEAQAHRLAPAVEGAEVVTAASQIGSGSLPVERLESRALALSAPGGKALEARAAAFRRLPIPVIGRISEGQLLFDLRTLDDEDAFLSQLAP
ncbi:MAG: L-seryl-tRNA(Sec) selenium transferase [Alphaproteobacteria bacterium]|nr:L-seryl-tRNA(Sec) selenium transferase [Alphaproteobacteria bacterium]